MGKPAPVSPFAPASLPDVPEVPGVGFATAEAGIRYKGRTDLLLAVLAPGTEVAGVLTRSKTRSAPVDWCALGLREGKARALVVNSGNANAFTGKKGMETVVITADAAAAAVGCPPGEVFIASTGVIGEPLDAGKFAHLLGKLAGETKADAWHAAARAVMTTDTFPKLATRTAKIDGCRGRDQRLLQGRRHDPAGHGDDAVLRLYRRADRRRGAAEPRRRQRRSHLQLRHHRRRHVDERHAAGLRHGRSGKARLPAHRRRHRSAPRQFRRRAARPAARAGDPRRQGRRGHHQVRHHRGRRRRERPRGAAHRARRSATRRW